METSETLQRILKQLHTRENAVVADMLRNSGYRYKTIFGVTIVDLRTIAKEYAPNHALAQELWNRDYRETKLLALLIENPEEATQEQINIWVNEFHTIEQVEQATYSLLPRLPWANELVARYCNNENLFVKAAGFLTAAKCSQLKTSNDEACYQQVIDLSVDYAADAGVHLKRALATALRLIGRRGGKLQKAVVQAAQTIQQQNTPSALEIADEALFEFVD